MRTKRRDSGRGGKRFERGNIHHILTNPIYAGKIRHKKNIYEGKHPALIGKDDWDRVQDKLVLRSARPRGRPNAANPSPLAGKLYDETGDRLTPSHSNRDGRKLRYYISNRLISDRSANHPTAWRLPALPLERAISDATALHLRNGSFLPTLIPDLSAEEIEPLQRRLTDTLELLNQRETATTWTKLISSTSVAQGQLSIELSNSFITKQLKVPIERLTTEHLKISAPFQMRRRHVEAKLILGGSIQQPEVDRTLAKNIVKAFNWLDAIKRSETFSEIAKREQSSVRRVQTVIELAFLTPDIIERAVSGTLPISVTSDRLLKKEVPI